MIILVGKLLEMLKERNIMVSRSSLLRWEKQGKIPKLFRSLGGWRYVDENYLEELINRLK